MPQQLDMRTCITGEYESLSVRQRKLSKFHDMGNIVEPRSASWGALEFNPKGRCTHVTVIPVYKWASICVTSRVTQCLRYVVHSYQGRKVMLSKVPHLLLLRVSVLSVCFYVPSFTTEC